MNNSTVTTDAHILTYNNELLQHYLPVSLFFAIAAVIGLVGNVIVVGFYGRKTQPKTAFTYLVRWLAWADFTVCVMLLIGAVEIGMHINFNLKYVCKVSYLFAQWTIYSSTWILGIISIDRYRKICQPFKSQMTSRFARIAVKVTLLPTFLLAARNVIKYDIVSADVAVYTDNGTVVVTGYYCGSTTDPDLKIYVTIFNMIDIVVLSMLFFIYFIAYGLIIHKLVAHRRNLQAWKETCHKATKDDCLGGADAGVQSNGKETSRDQSKSQPSSDSIAQDHVELQDIRFAIKTNLDENGDTILSRESVTNEVKHVTEDSGIANRCGHITSVSETCETLNATNGDVIKVNTHKATPKSGIKRSEYQITVMMVWVTAIFLLTFSSFFIGNLVFRREPDSEQSLSPLTLFMIKCVFLNSVSNPIIFFICNASFKAFVREVLMCKTQ